MQCDICARKHTSKLPFYCATCGRNALYELRLENARTLVDKEALGRQVEAFLPPNSSKDVGKPGAGTAAQRPSRISSRLDVEQATARTEESLERIQVIQNQADVLQKDIEQGRAQIAKLKASLAQRRSDYGSAAHNLPARRAATLESVEKGIKRIDHRWNTLHTRTAEARVFLCREAADLYGLKQRRRKKGGTVREDYMICGVGIVDLRDLNSMLKHHPKCPPPPPLLLDMSLIPSIDVSSAHITTSITHLAHLLVLISHYLSLRLPAEITLPHRDYPLPTIFTPSSSYSARKVPFPGTMPHSSGSSLSASRIGDSPPLPRPRPLFLEKPLPVLAKDDPAAYSLFVEGVTLLAWDVAWLCRTQGLNISSNGGSGTWEDVCPLGRNLWLLLAAPTPSPRAPPTPTSDPTTTSSKSQSSKTPQPVTLGQYSHGTAHTFLGAASAAEYMRSWKFLHGPMKIVDRVKSALLGEMAGAEWEVLDEREWAGESGVTEGANPGGKVGEEGKRRSKAEGGDAVAAAVVVGEAGGGTSETSSAKTKPGTSGWTKLKSR
ncbi:MAG: hypothetical protein M1813_001196 [Trichoglossum hirsutum]|nr:MAG: hypothetical protein M1813_001196 [Trichoglossum hirsutum]